MRKTETAFGILLTTIIATISGAVLLFQSQSSILDRVGGFNFLAGGLLMLYWLLAPKVTKKQKEDSTVIVWVVLLTAFQLWYVLGLYLIVSPKWQLRLRKVATYFFIVAGIYLMIYVISAAF